MPEVSVSEWDSFLSHYPNSHIMQTSMWGKFKSDFGWEAVRLLVDDVDSGGPMGVQILFKRLPLGIRFAYIPKGPVCDTSQGDLLSKWNKLCPALDELCRQKRAAFLKVEPDLLDPPRFRAGTEPTTQPVAEIYPQIKNGGNEVADNIPAGFQHAFHSIQPRRTLLVSLNGDEDRILGRMKQKTRYNVRLALKKNVIVQPTADLDLFYNLIQVTGDRDTFEVHSREYYQRAYEIFHPRGMCELLVAEYQGEPLAALMVFAHGRRAWYFYGASSNLHRDRMPTYLLQWEAMRWARSTGCVEYDLWGVPDEDERTLEENFSNQSGGLWGVYRFKRGFGGRLYRAVESWDKVYNSTIYSLYKYWFTR